MSAKETPDYITLTRQEAEALKDRVKAASAALSAQDITILTGLISFNLWLQNQLSRAKLSIRRLKNLFGFSTEKNKPKASEPDESNANEAPSNDETTENGEGNQDEKNTAVPSPPKEKPKNKPVWDPNQNHGRYGADDYTGCLEVNIKHETLCVGARCPHCAEAELSGKLGFLDPGTLIRLQGNPLISGTKYWIERFRCGLCGTQYEADVPTEIKTQPKYAASCLSTLAIAHYYNGLPFKRIETWQGQQGIPLPDATQWDKMKKLNGITAPVCQVLQQLSVEGDGFYYDDTTQTILENQALVRMGGTSRKQVYSTAVISKVGPYEITLFFTSQCYAGENIKPLLESRESEEDFYTMTDAHRLNIPNDMDEALLARWVICFCLVHGRRKFFEIAGSFDKACDFVLEQISEVYRHEAHCKTQKLDPQQRLAYHQTHSLPLMQALWVWLNNQLLYAQVEPNSGLGDAVRYMLRHWEALTRFLHVAGVPIDNSLAERTIKVLIRYRKNSLFYKTFYGACVGDHLMGLIHTAVRNQANPFDYLNALQDYQKEVADSPQLWLPWNYQRTKAELSEKSAQAA